VKKYTKQQIESIPMILKCHWYKEWIKESKKPDYYLGRLAILVKGKKINECHWETEGIDFEIIN
jgi:hypothetical protein